MMPLHSGNFSAFLLTVLLADCFGFAQSWCMKVYLCPPWGHCLWWYQGRLQKEGCGLCWK